MWRKRRGCLLFAAGLIIRQLYGYCLLDTGGVSPEILISIANAELLPHFAMVVQPPFCHGFLTFDL